MRDATGQTTAEYAALLGLVGIALAASGAVVGVGDVAAAVAAGVRTGICIVAGDVCRASDAEAAGLLPCTVSEDTSGDGVTITVLSVRAGGKEGLTVATRSDGTVLVVESEGRSLGAETGVGIEASGLGLEFGVEGQVDFTFDAGRAWEFPDAASAARFLAGEREGVSPAWRFGDAGSVLQGEAGASIGGATLTGIESTANAALGVRAGQGRVTYYLRGRLDALDAKVWVPHRDATWHGPSTGEVIVEVTREGGELRELAFRTAQSGPGKGQVTDTVARLDLRDPRNRAAAAPLLDRRLPWPGGLVGDLTSLVRRAVQTGVVERSVYDVRDDSGEFKLSAKLGVALGFDVDDVEIERRLVAASAWTNGSRERERADCGVTGAGLERTS